MTTVIQNWLCGFISFRVWPLNICCSENLMTGIQSLQTSSSQTRRKPSVFPKLNLFWHVWSKASVQMLKNRKKKLKNLSNEEAHDIYTRFISADPGISVDTCHSSLQQWAKRDREKHTVLLFVNRGYREDASGYTAHFRHIKNCLRGPIW